MSGIWEFGLFSLPFLDSRMIAQKGFFLVGGWSDTQSRSDLSTHICDEYPYEEFGDLRKVSEFEKREISSLTIRFGLPTKGSKYNLSDLNGFVDSSSGKIKSFLKFGPKWTATAFTLRVPKEYKRKLLEILNSGERLYEKQNVEVNENLDNKINEDRMYPPLLETKKLFRNCIEESFDKDFS